MNSPPHVDAHRREDANEATEQPGKVLVALATYNEIENLPSLVAEIHRQLPQADVFVVDDNSPDGTGQWCDEFAPQNPWLQCRRRAGKLGLGSATWVAMQHAIAARYDWLITLDADWSHPPEALPRLLRAAHDADLVIGSRYCEGGSIEGWPRRRYYVSRIVNRASSLLARLPARDSSTAYRLYRVRLLAELDFTNLRAAGYAYLEESLWHLARLGARVKEIPITFHERRAGASKVNLAEAWGKLRTLASLAVRKYE